MSEILEHVAKAIYEGRNGHGAKAFRSQPKAHQEPYFGDARAAILAMREPTESVLRAGGDALDGDGPLSAEVWQAMIDEALK